MLKKIYVLTALMVEFGTVYGMEKEQAKPDYIEDARQLCQEKGLCFSVLPKDILGIVQYYRLNELLDRALGTKTYSEALTGIQKLIAANEYGELFNSSRLIDRIINRLSSTFGKDPEEVAQDINTSGTSLWLTHIRPTQVKFLDAAYIGDLATVQQLIAAGANVNDQDKNRSTALILAARYEHIEIVKMLIAAGANVNTQDRDYKTALMVAALEGHAEVVKELIGARANVNACSHVGQTALMESASKGRTEVVKRLIEAGVDVNAQDTIGWTALMEAASKGHIEVLKELIGAWVDVNAQNIHGCTALMWAVTRGHKEAVNVLIAAGAGVTMLDDYGKTALDYARQQNNKDIIELLRKATNKS